MSSSSKDDAEWERIWRRVDDEFLIESAKDHLWQNLQAPQPVFNRFSQICREAHRRGKPELLRQAVQRLVPIRTASGEDLRGLLRALEGLMSAMIPAGQEILRFSGENAALLELMRERLKKAREVMARFAPKRKTSEPGLRNQRSVADYPARTARCGLLRCLFVRHEGGDQAEIACNVCGAVVCTLPVDEVGAVMSRMSESGTISTVRCPHLRRPARVPWILLHRGFICQECGEGVDASPPVQ